MTDLTNVVPIKKISRLRRGVNKRLTLIVTADQYIALNNVANFEGATMTAIVRRAIVEELLRIRDRRYD